MYDISYPGIYFLSQVVKGKVEVRASILPNGMLRFQAEQEAGGEVLDGPDAGLPGAIGLTLAGWQVV
jgi:hypothetical protein